MSERARQAQQPSIGRAPPPAGSSLSSNPVTRTHLSMNHVTCTHPPQHEHGLGANHLLPKVGYVGAVHRGAARRKCLRRRLRQPVVQDGGRQGAVRTPGLGCENHTTHQLAMERRQLRTRPDDQHGRSCTPAGSLAASRIAACMTGKNNQQSSAATLPQQHSLRALQLGSWQRVGVLFLNQANQHIHCNSTPQQHSLRQRVAVVLEAQGGVVGGGQRQQRPIAAPALCGTGRSGPGGLSRQQ